MRRDDGSLMFPPVEELVEKIPQKYELVLTATKRAKQLIIEMRHNPGQFSQEQMRTKPITLALHEIASGQLDKDALLAADIDFSDPDPDNEFHSELDRYERPSYDRQPAGFTSEAVDMGEDDYEDDDDDDGIDWEDSFTDDEEPEGP
ncbi:DNA-directed RNA polymerase subunit omega [bacterium]|nr:DNA-directed RNA polymerase subunit omega [bacterium]